ncbi:uncharacterized protein LOC127878418 [Dreissena polymorpha]|uniref:uncharacterized protein LOC127878418 n=1 Tax=Dreissena polymorpha TaxID=45954 RepID=UPI00226453DE|nr:uncharacterized protein LOC127878418 [Dreissena polymorpha]
MQSKRERGIMETLCVLLLLCIALCLTKVSSSLRLVLSAELDNVVIGRTLRMTCSTPSPVSVVTWQRKAKGSSYITVDVIQEFVNGKCNQKTSESLDCYCNSATSYSCAIKRVNISNMGQSWLCSAAINQTTIYSNEYTIHVKDATEVSTVDNVTDKTYTVSTAALTWANGPANDISTDISLDAVSTTVISNDEFDGITPKSKNICKYIF